MRIRLISSLAWMSVASIGAKGAALITQVAVGFYLTSADVGIAALASAIFAIASPMGEQGVQKLLVVNRGHKHDIWPAVRRIAFAFQFGTAIVFLAVAGWLAHIGRQAETIVLALHLPVLLALAWVGMARARLQIAGAFRSIAATTAYGALAKAAVMIALLLAGASFYAFPLSLLLSKLFELFLLHRAAPPASLDAAERSQAIDAGAYRDIRRAALWIALGTFSAAMVNNADYLALGALASGAILGQYFFGYQSVAAVSTIIAAGFGTVMLPTFSAKQGSERLALLGGSLTSVLLIASPLFIAAALVVPWVFALVWGDKWTEASWVASLMLIALTTRMFGPLLRSFLEAQQRWRLQAFLSLGDGVMMLAVAVTAALLFADSERATLWIALMVALYRWTYGLVLVGVTVAKLKGTGLIEPRALVVFGTSTVAGAALVAWIIGSPQPSLLPVFAFVGCYTLFVMSQPAMRRWHMALLTKFRT